jgi:glycosyltransferase involved in cell wall biosynthesis
MNDNLSVILPAFNEEGNIKNVIDSILQGLNYVPGYEIIVVDDGSRDQTPKIVARMKEFFANIKLVSHEQNQGYGRAIKSGIQAADHEWILIMDADGQLRIGDFKGFWQRRHGQDFILGFRRRRNDDFYRFFMGRLGNLVSGLFLRKKIADINCGFKLFRKEDLKFLDLSTAGNAIYFEILYKLLRKNKNKFLQCPVDHFPREHGRPTGGNFKTIFKIAPEAVRILLQK